MDGTKTLGLDGQALNALYGRSLLLTRDWTAAELEALLAVAARFEALDRSGRAPAQADFVRVELSMKRA